jgi:hypothetical protein
MHVSIDDSVHSQRYRNLAKTSASMMGQTVENRRHCELFISWTRCNAGGCIEGGGDSTVCCHPFFAIVRLVHKTAKSDN